MKRITLSHKIPWATVAGILVGLTAMLLTVSIAGASPSQQEADPHDTMGDQACKDCHLDITESWKTSPHAHAFDDPVFQGRWSALGHPGDCLLCHTTNYQDTNNAYTATGVSCEACHGEVQEGHPPDVVPIRADTEYCGECHTTTLHEWRLTGHASAGVGCMDCHDPHSQDRLFAASDDLCINCHKEDMGDYLNDLHVQKDIGCVDCHALVIPPENPPVDGIVPTGHTFTMSAATCVACHTDSLHSGFSLPGYEAGAKAVSATIQEADESEQGPQDALVGTALPQSENGLSLQQRVQALEAQLASNRMSTLFQGGIVGLVLGGSTAWFVSYNSSRASSRREEDEEEETS
jgi:predicted CXXCH cytochrome family protein